MIRITGITENVNQQLESNVGNQILYKSWAKIFQWKYQLNLLASYLLDLYKSTNYNYMHPSISLSRKENLKIRIEHLLRVWSCHNISPFNTAMTVCLPLKIQTTKNNIKLLKQKIIESCILQGLQLITTHPISIQISFFS